MVIIELLIILFKAIILSVVYSGIILFILVILGKYKTSNWIKAILKQKFNFYLLIHPFVCMILLLLTSLSHDTGIGDNSIIPIGYGQTIQNEDFAWTYFYPDLAKTKPNKDELIILDYTVANNKICAEVSHEFSPNPKYDFIVFDLPTQTLTTLSNESEYDKYASNYTLPSRTQFYGFERHFHEYLESRPFWKKWLIP